MDERAREVLAEHVGGSFGAAIRDPRNDVYHEQYGAIGPHRAIAAMHAYAAELTRELEAENAKLKREVAAVWCCAIGDATGAIDILRNEWLNSRRKAEREAGARLATVGDLVWAARSPAPASYSGAAELGKALHARVRTALTGQGEGG